MDRKVKITGLVFAIIVLYYDLQYASSAVHYNCHIIKDDCVPPINLTSELIYRIMVHPSWLNQFDIEPMTYFFKDGEFSFWEADVNGKAVIIRIQKDESPVMQWIEQGLPPGTPIRPANGEHIQQWLKDHPEYELIK